METALIVACIAAVATVSASIIAGYIAWKNIRRAGEFTLHSSKVSRDTKISEFRQAWINALRDDIADYITAADLWMKKWVDSMALDYTGPEDYVDKRAKLYAEANELSNRAYKFYYRIHLRLNPLPNKHKAEDDDFLASLKILLDPGKPAPIDTTKPIPEGDVKLDPVAFEGNWRKEATDIVEKGRKLLKREWEVAKRGELQ